jgi:Mycothiol maleylpyruvate isomerase N-terminal domain
MTSEPADLTLLGVADQVADLLGRVDDDMLDGPTPCADWTVGGLVDHIVRAPVVFTTIMRGEEPDWSSAPPRIGPDRVARFREAADGLLEAEQPAPPDADAYTRIAAFAGRHV